MTPRMIRATTPEAAIGIGWSKGIASQESLPSISASRPVRDVGRRPALLGSWPGRQRLCRDLVEEMRIAEPEGFGRVADALLGERGIARLVERRLARLGRLDPGVEIGVR